MGTRAVAAAMQRWLLFDGSCAKCSAIATHIHSSIPRKLEAMSLGDDRAHRLLDAANPDWTWEPALVEQRGTTIKAYRGRALVVRLSILLGPVRAWRVHQFARGEGITIGEILGGIHGPASKQPCPACADQAEQYPRGAEVLRTVQQSAAYREFQDALVSERAVDLWYDDEQQQHLITFALRGPETGVERLAAFAVDLAGQRVTRASTLIVETTPDGWRTTNQGAAAAPAPS